jgi:hypothetical protein
MDPDLAQFEGGIPENYGRFAHGLVFGNPLADEVRSRGDVEPEAVEAAIASALRKEFGDEPNTMPLQAIVMHGWRPRSST